MRLIKFFTASLLFTILFPILSFAKTTIVADHTILVSNYSFTPSELTILPGETVAFINVEGLHTVNGVNSTLTGESFNNPVEFFLPEIEGIPSGVLMGEITFDQAGIYQYDCSIGFHAQLGMVASITVDAFTISDLLAAPDSVPDIWSSAFAFNTYLDTLLNGEGPFTVFVPNTAAVNEIQELMNLNQFDLLGFYDLAAALEYHVATGLWLADDLAAGMSLPTVYGQDLTISETGGVLEVDGACILSSNYLADNGVIHVIDKCLAPSGLPQATVWDIIKNSADHQLLEAAILNAYLDEELSAQNDLDPSLDLPGPFTVFAPTDAAFEAYSLDLGMTTAELLAGQFVDEIVKMHVIGNQLESGDFFDGQQLQNYLGEFNQMTVNVDGIFVEDIELQSVDLIAYNGVVHVINEIIAPEIPEVEGTCGTWTLVLEGTDIDGWEGSFIEVEVDGEIISTETVSGGFSSSFQFAVDVDSEVNLRCSSGSVTQSYKLYNTDNDLIFSSGSGSSVRPSSVFGLTACGKPKSCGDVEIEMFDSVSDGWDFGILEVHINDELYTSIPMPYGAGPQKAYIPTSIGDTLDFFYNGGAFPIENSFIVYGPDGVELANQFNINQTPENVFDLVVCADDITATIEQIDQQYTSIFPNPSTGTLNIKSDLEISRVVFYNLLGQQVYETLYNQTTLDVSSLEANNYILEIQTEKGLEFHTFSIIR